VEIYLIRHTTPKIEKGVCYGQADIGVSSTFKKEVETIQSKINVNEDSVIYTSPLKRCVLLAKKISDTIIYDHRLKELDFGNWELHTWDTINQNDLNKWMNNFVYEQVPNGESYTNLHTRSTSFFQEILQLHKKQVFIITHAGVIRSIIAHILKMDLKDSFNIKINYGAIIHLKYSNEKVSIQSGMLIDDKFM